ncbi:hypothetical protein GE118_01555 [Mycoplasma sp. NEAQ87857]|uniref:hypothetical protein n=1 Tax=Mycoplasma sp. NEAQ87857 TaxID=2683967 RepID=UPI001315B8E8|nr:hypothetical protein [Mycoplasma sp. NEAQ87857]QGZ97481.1 hypothetical protein GE118_01555 [Mycoplasma sp. NEAQ87857]
MTKKLRKFLLLGLTSITAVGITGCNLLAKPNVENPPVNIPTTQSHYIKNIDQNYVSLYSYMINNYAVANTSKWFSSNDPFIELEVANFEKKDRKAFNELQNFTNVNEANLFVRNYANNHLLKPIVKNLNNDFKLMRSLDSSINLMKKLTTFINTYTNPNEEQLKISEELFEVLKLSILNYKNSIVTAQINKMVSKINLTDNQDLNNLKTKLNDLTNLEKTMKLKDTTTLSVVDKIEFYNKYYDASNLIINEFKEKVYPLYLKELNKYNKTIFNQVRPILKGKALNPFASPVNNLPRIVGLYLNENEIQNNTFIKKYKEKGYHFIPNNQSVDLGKFHQIVVKTNLLTHPLQIAQVYKTSEVENHPNFSNKYLIKMKLVSQYFHPKVFPFVSKSPISSELDPKYAVYNFNYFGINDFNFNNHDLNINLRYKVDDNLYVPNTQWDQYFYSNKDVLVAYNYPKPISNIAVDVYFEITKEQYDAIINPNNLTSSEKIPVVNNYKGDKGNKNLGIEIKNTIINQLNATDKEQLLNEDDKVFSNFKLNITFN